MAQSDRSAQFVLVLAALLAVVFANSCVPVSSPMPTPTVVVYPTGSPLPNDVDDLVQILKNGNATERIDAANAVALLGDDGEVAIPPLIENISYTGHGQVGVRIASMRALGRMGASQAIPTIGNVLLNDSRAEIREQAAHALGDLGDLDGLEYLGRALYDTDVYVATFAAYAIQDVTGLNFPNTTPIRPSIGNDAGLSNLVINARIWWEDGAAY